MHYRKYIVGMFAMLISIGIGWLALFRPNWLLIYTLLTFVFGYVLLWMCITPAGNLIFGPKVTEGPSLLRWFGNLVVGQVVLLIFTVAAYVAFIGHGPEYIGVGLPLTFTEHTIVDNTRWMWGIFPWGIFGFWGLILGYVTYIKKGQPFFYQFARGFISPRFEPMIKAYVESTVNGATMLALTLVACAITLLICYAIESHYQMDHFEVPAMTYMVLSFFMFYIAIKPGKILFKRLTVRSRSYVLFFSFMILVLIALFVLSGFLNVWFAKAHPELAKFNCPECLAYFNRISSEIRFASIYWGWWLIWTPLAGSYLAHISAGRTIREFVVGLFIVPFTLIIMYLYWGIAPLERCYIWIQKVYLLTFASVNFTSTQAYFDFVQAMMLLSLGMICAALFMKMLKQFKTSTLLTSGYMPLNDGPVSRLWLKDAIKAKGISKIAQKLAFLMLGTLLLHTISGWYGIQVEVFAMGILVLNSAYAGFDLLMIRFLIDSAWIGNQNIPPYK